MLLEDPKAAESFRIMNLIAPNNVKHNLLEKAQEIKTKEQYYSSLYSKYKNTKLFKKSEILKECIKFNMYFDNARSYKGELSLEFVSKISNFLKENNLLVSEDQYRSNIFMLGYMDFESKKRSRHAYFKKIKKIH